MTVPTRSGIAAQVGGALRTQNGTLFRVTVSGLVILVMLKLHSLPARFWLDHGAGAAAVVVPILELETEKLRDPFLPIQRAQKKPVGLQLSLDCVPKPDLFYSNCHLVLSNPSGHFNNVREFTPEWGLFLARDLENSPTFET